MRLAPALALAVACAACLLAPSTADASPAASSVEDDDDMVISDDDGEQQPAKKGRRKGGKGGKGGTRPEGQGKKKKSKGGKGSTGRKGSSKKGGAKDKGDKPTALELGSEAELSEAKGLHAKLFLMVYSDIDPHSHMAMPRFRRAAQQWGAPGNVTLAMAEAQNLPETAELLGLEHAGSIDKLPMYGLFLAGIDRPVLYKGGWAKESIGAWLHHQAELQPIALRSPQHLDELIVERAKRDDGYGLVAVGLFGPEHVQTFELAARSSKAHMSVATGDEAMATRLGAPFPSVLMAWKDAQMPWALLSDDAASELTAEDISRFIAMRGLPPRVVPLGYAYKDRYADQVFKSRSRRGDDRLLVLLFHKFKKQPKTELNQESAAAVQVMRETAPGFAGVALFASHDFFDNDPSGVEEYYDIKEKSLPTVVVLQEGGPRWHLQGPVRQRAVENLVERALKESQLPRDPPPEWQTLSKPTALLARDEL